MTEMIDLVSRAIDRSAQERGHRIPPVFIRHLAVAAIEAMREPTNPMVDAAHAVGAYWHHDTCELLSEWREEMRQEYRAMINTALWQGQ